MDRLEKIILQDNRPAMVKLTLNQMMQLSMLLKRDRKSYQYIIPIFGHKYDDNYYSEPMTTKFSFLCDGDVAQLDAQNNPNPDGAINVGDALVILSKSLGIVNF